MKRYTPQFENLRLLAAITEMYPRANSQVVARRVKAGTVNRWTVTELGQMFPQNKLGDIGWVDGAKNAYFYDHTQVAAALEPTGLYEPIAPKMSQRAKEKLRIGLTQAYNDGGVPAAAQGLLAKAKEWGGTFQRNITLTNAEVVLFDAITSRMRGDKANLRISWVNLFKRWMGHFIVAHHPAMVDRNYAQYFAWVNGSDFDLLSLVGALGYDDLDDFAEQLMIPINASREPQNRRIRQQLWATIGKSAGLTDPTHPLHAVLCSLQVQIAEATADAVIGKATGIPRMREALALMAMSREPDMPDPDMVKIMQTIKLVQEAGFAFDGPKLVAVDREKAEAFHNLVIEATDKRKWEPQ